MLVCRPLEDAGFVNAFSTRLGGVSLFPFNDLNLAGYSEDTRENIEENRRRFLAAIGGDFRLTTVWQVHGDTVKTVDSDQTVADSEDRADALISNLNSVLVGVKTADCVPVLVSDPQSGAFAAIHAGWRGTVQSIVSKAIESMTAKYGSKPSDLIAAVGPAASCRMYEVGHDVIDAFAASFELSERYFMPKPNGQAYVDLHSANHDQLTSLGVLDENIYIAPLCTMERTDLFFSYRAEKERYGRTGRLMSVIGRKHRRCSSNAPLR